MTNVNRWLLDDKSTLKKIVSHPREAFGVVGFFIVQWLRGDFWTSNWYWKRKSTSARAFWRRHIQHGSSRWGTACCAGSNMGKKCLLLQTRWIGQAVTSGSRSDRYWKSRSTSERASRGTKTQPTTPLRLSSSGWATMPCSVSDPVTFNNLWR